MSEIDTFINEIVADIRQSPQNMIDNKWHNVISGSTLSFESLCLINALIEKLRPKNILEFGCGVSTQFICDVIKDHNDCNFHSVENIEKFLIQTKSSLETNSNTVNFILAPIEPMLIDSCLFVTYSKSLLNKLDKNTHLDLVIIDGPLGRIFRRDAPLFLIKDKLHPGSIVLLDDSNRPREQEALTLWKKIFGDSIEIIEVPDFHKGLTVVIIREELPPLSFCARFRIQKIFDSIYSIWKNMGYMNKIKQLKLV